MPLTGRRILVPPTRVDLHPLAGMLKRRNADVVEVPSIEPAPPASFASADAALAELPRFGWIVFVGSVSVAHFFARDENAADRMRARICALGSGTRKALTRRGLDVTIAPQRHVGADVADEMGDVTDTDVLLVRRERASRDLPRILTERGARVTEADGYEMVVRATPEGRAELLAAPFQCVALGNPTAARFLGRALTEWDLGPETFDGALVATAGAITAREAAGIGLASGLTVDGRIIDLAREIEAAL